MFQRPGASIEDARERGRRVSAADERAGGAKAAVTSSSD